MRRLFLNAIFISSVTIAPSFEQMPSVKPFAVILNKIAIEDCSSQKTALQ
jgi:hypothetical protein